MSFMGDVKSKFFETTVAAGVAVIAAAARPTTTFTLTTGAGSAAGMGTNIGRKITATTTGTGDVGKTVALVGIGVDGEALEESITLLGTAATTAGTTNYFVSVTTATVNTQPAANVSLGILTATAGQVFAGPTRVRQANIYSGGAIGSVDFRSGSTSGTSLLTVRTNATLGNSTTVNIPQDGVYFTVGGTFVTFDETDCNAVTVYYDG
tara:strand:- start:39 stop:662 length:624 start_codon:yes stop_codon:yes gene_type:complete